jgi:hypothetical protein
MDRATTSTPDRRPLLAVVALAFVAAAIFAATALAAGGSSGGGASDPASGSPFSFVDDGQPAADAPRGDCPDDGSGGSSGSSGSSTQSDGLGTRADV